MGRIPAKQITSWSFSRYTTYRDCPLKAKLKFLDRIQEPGNIYMDRGNEIHKMAEDYTKGKIARLPKDLAQFKDLFAMLKKQYKKSISGMTVESTWAFTKSWDETVWNDWVNCWLRIKVDASWHEDDVTLIVGDHKTGKYRPDNQEDYLEQLSLYALGAFLMLPHIEVVKPRLIYLDHGITYPEDPEDVLYTRDELPTLIKIWEKRVKGMLNDTVFAPRPSGKCTYCFYRASNKGEGGGQCKF